MPGYASGFVRFPLTFGVRTALRWSLARRSINYAATKKAAGCDASGPEAEVRKLLEWKLLIATLETALNAFSAVARRRGLRLRFRPDSKPWSGQPAALWSLKCCEPAGRVIQPLP
jgi:hypothetical protein